MNKKVRQLGFLDAVEVPRREPVKREPCEVCHKELVRGEDCWVCPSGHVIDWDDDDDQDDDE